MEKYHKHINSLKEKQITKFLYASNHAQPGTALDTIPVPTNVDKNNIYLTLRVQNKPPRRACSTVKYNSIILICYKEKDSLL